MGIVTIHVGQCGNQIGAQFWGKALSSMANKDGLQLSGSFFDEENHKARSILVDSEPKVVRGLSSLRVPGAKAPGKEPYRPRETVDENSLFRASNVLWEQSGRGNNWAMGYFGRHGAEGRSEDSLTSRALESLRLEAERCDRFDGCVITHSLSGGTGSGLGSRVLEEIRASYPRQYLTSVAVQPFKAGDTPLQHYNSLLALRSLQQHSDGIILMGNDEILKALGGGAKAQGTNDVVEVGMESMNAYIADAMLGLLQPTELTSYYEQYRSNKKLSSRRLGLKQPRPQLRAFEPYDLVASVCPMPGLKLMELWTTAGLSTGQPKGANSKTTQVAWGQLATTLCRVVPRFEAAAEPAEAATPRQGRRGGAHTHTQGQAIKALGYQLISRGDLDGQLEEAAFFRRTVGLPLERQLPTPSWNPFPADHKRGLGSRSLTLCCNRSSSSTQIARVLRKARKLYESGAYLHWYERYGCDAELLESSFESAQCVVDDYLAMTR